MKYECEGAGRREPTPAQAGRPEQTITPREAGERAHRVDRRQFLKGAVEMAAGGLLVFESTHHLTEGVLKEVWQANETLVQQDRVDTAIANPTKQKKAKEGYPKLRYGVDVVKAGIGSYLTNIGFDRINSLAAK